MICEECKEDKEDVLESVIHKKDRLFGFKKKLLCCSCFDKIWGCE